MPVSESVASRVAEFVEYRVWTGPAAGSRLGERLAWRVADMRDRKLKLFLAKAGGTGKEALRLFHRQEDVKGGHLRLLEDKQIEAFLFSKVEQTKGNVRYNRVTHVL